MPELKVVRVKSSHPDHEQGFYIINESDFDPAKHERWEDPAWAAARQKRALEADLAAQVKPEIENRGPAMRATPGGTRVVPIEGANKPAEPPARRDPPQR